MHIPTDPIFTQEESSSSCHLSSLAQKRTHVKQLHMHALRDSTQSSKCFPATHYSQTQEPSLSVDPMRQALPPPSFQFTRKKVSISQKLKQTHNPTTSILSAPTFHVAGILTASLRGTQHFKDPTQNAFSSLHREKTLSTKTAPHNPQTKTVQAFHLLSRCPNPPTHTSCIPCRPSCRCL